MDKNKGRGTEQLQPEAAAPGEAYEPLTHTQAVRCLDACASTAVDYITHNFPRFWDEWVGSIEKREENARSNKEQIALGETVKLLQKRGPAVQQRFVELLQACFADFSRQKLQTPVGQERFSRSEGLSLVDNSELEETIAITSICHRADTQFAEALWALHQRLALLNGGKKIDERGNPVSPVQFCDVLRRLVADLSLDARTKVVGYKHFEAALIKPIGGLYDELNHYLAAEGIMANLRYSAVSRQDTSAQPEQSQQPPSEEAEPERAKVQEAAVQASGDAEQAPRRRATDRIFSEGESKDPEQYQQGLISAIRLLQTHLGVPGSSAPAAGGSGVAAAQAGATTAVARGPQPSQGGGVTPLSSAPLMGAIGHLQHQVAESSHALAEAEMNEIQPLAVASVSQQLLAEMQKRGEDEVRSDDMHTIELVGLLFEYILSDEQLPDSVKALLSYLHTPVLKLAFIDKEFFEKVDHPARVLLNQMAEAGARWISNDGTNQYNIYAKVRTTVFHILENFGNDVKVFAEALLEFSAYTRNVLRRQELMEKRAMEKARGEEKLREAKIQVNREISRRIDGKDLPSPVLLLLLLPWSDYLSFIILRYGAESDSCRQALKVADDLLWSIEPKLLEVDKIRQLEVQDKLLQSLQSGFETIGYEQNKSRKLLDAVISLQKLALKSQKVEPAPEPMRAKLETMAAEKAGNVEKENSAATVEESQLIEKLKLIEFGTWLEDERGKRLKVAWYNHKTMHYMLVDQQGRKVSMTSALQLARAMIAGKLRVIAGSAKPFFERALENIYHSLNARASGELLNRES
ncbi:DUF1631 family protein [Gilvimarinus algae]|uniref:DUF1631 family protein n=1 Tax=Gilvimarinus algae TaxID=3058037 RepID=A0ABT8TH42_9GAMM|nr:DUF1631 family protein [Gilvimarinus sp. SDUM040014]MDO3383416.1 DUF1631 family protein [Gilvimarinus sp. SDUM040014]